MAGLKRGNLNAGREPERDSLSTHSRCRFSPLSMARTKAASGSGDWYQRLPQRNKGVRGRLSIVVWLLAAWWQALGISSRG